MMCPFWYIPPMALRGIIFDKDGTLLDYYSVWAPVFRNSIDMILDRVGRSGDEQLRREILRMLGIGDDGVHAKGLVFDASKKVMLAKMWMFSKRWGISFRKLLAAFKEGYHGGRAHLESSLAQAEPAGNPKKLLSRLKDAGYAVGMVTSDTRKSTDMCLDILEVSQYFDFISTFDDQYRNKPHPESLRAFCSRFSIEPSETAVVGDTVIDLIYGKRGKAGYNVAVMTGCGDHKRLSRHADVVYDTIDDLHNDIRVFPDSLEKSRQIS